MPPSSSEDGTLSTPIIKGVIDQVVLPRPLTVVAQGWPSCLVTALAMDLPLAGVFFPEKFHAYFPKSKPGFASWNTLLDLEQHTCGSYESIHMISGTIEFIKQYVPGQM